MLPGLTKSTKHSRRGPVSNAVPFCAMSEAQKTTAWKRQGSLVPYILPVFFTTQYIGNWAARDSWHPQILKAGPKPASLKHPNTKGPHVSSNPWLPETALIWPYIPQIGQATPLFPHKLACRKAWNPVLM